MKLSSLIAIPFLICLLGCSKDDSSVKTLQYIKIKSVTINEFPPTDNGAGWDILDGPDIYFALVYNGSEFYTSLSDVRTNTLTASKWTITTNLNFDKPQDSYGIRLYDDDSFDPDDFIGGITFTPYTPANGTPSTINLSCTGCNTKWTLELEYIY